MVTRIESSPTSYQAQDVQPADTSTKTDPLPGPVSAEDVPPADVGEGTPPRTPSWDSSDFARQYVRAEEDRLRMYYLRTAVDDSTAEPGYDPGSGGGTPPTTFTVEEATEVIDEKIDPRLGNMDPVLAARLSNMDQSPTWAGAIPPGSDVRGVWFRNFYLDGNEDPNEPDAQLYTYDRGGTLYTFEVAGSFAQAYRGIDPGLPGSNSRLGLPVSGQEVMQPDHPLYSSSGSQPVYYQNFEHGTLVETRAAQGNQPAQFTWYDRNGNEVVKDYEVPGVNLASADHPRSGGLVKPVDAPLTRGSEFGVRDPEGAPDRNGVTYHAAKDWFAPAGTTVRAPVDGVVLEVKPTRGNSGQVFGGAVYVQGEDGRVWVFRHVDPNIKVGDRVSAGDPIARVTDWTDGSDHTHVELWKTYAGGYNYENMIDPMSELGAFL
jgi:murein DD-endopeptidase MepM/ murein hydrolase activator NlpD